MITVSGFIQSLKLLFPSVTFYNGTINRKNKQCIGVYAKGNSLPVRSIGTTSSYNTLPIRILIHWTEDTDECEIMSNSIYSTLYDISDLVVSGKRVVSCEMLDSSPVDLSRDADNVCEMVVRLNLIYER